MDVLLLSPCDELERCEGEEFIMGNHIWPGDEFVRDVLPLSVAAVLKEMATYSEPYVKKSLAFLWPVTVTVFAKSEELERLSLDAKENSIRTIQHFLASNAQFWNNFQIMDEVSLNCIVHSLSTNTFSELEAVFSKTMDNTFRFDVYARTSRVTTCFLVVDEDSVGQNAGISGNVFTDDDVSEIFVLSILLLMMYIILAVMETPHIGLCSFKFRAPGKLVFLINIMLAVTQSLVVRALMLLGWELRNAVEDSAGNLFSMANDIRHQFYRQALVSYLLSLQVLLLMAKSVVMPSFLHSTLTSLIRSLRLTLQRLWQVLALVLLGIFAMSTLLYSITDDETLALLTLEGSFISILKAESRSLSSASRLFLPFDLFVGLFLMTILLAYIADIAEDQQPDETISSSSDEDSDDDSFGI
ncbi:uncharacterized protein LOC108682233 [Hyalella azteca]|uniref:Uncharacterized protein LOC108682233 n=1 Tax=Hyalella azteca TaxID=294128 RepID=A0A8B7PNC6_HYAAZ|nr:uncharacterized protein LOC108682233 [Hyalella azteca]